MLTLLQLQGLFGIELEMCWSIRALVVGTGVAVSCFAIPNGCVEIGLGQSTSNLMWKWGSQAATQCGSQAFLYLNIDSINWRHARDQSLAQICAQAQTEMVTGEPWHE